MNFEELFEKVKNNTATEEEREYVKKVIKEANETFDADNKETITPAPANEHAIQKLKKKINLKVLFRAIWISLASVAALTAVGAGVFFGVAYCPAKNNIQYDEAAAANIALQLVNDDVALYGANPVLKHVDREFELTFPRMSDSYFKYEVEIVTDTMKVEVNVNADTGTTTTHIN